MAIDNLNLVGYKTPQIPERNFGELTTGAAFPYVSGQNPSSTSSQDKYNSLMQNINNLDGTFEANRANPFATPALSKITESGEIQFASNPTKAKSYQEKFASGELSTVDAMELLAQNEDLLNNAKNYEIPQGKYYDLGDGEHHGVYNELLHDYMA